MRIISRRVLRAFWEQHPDAEQQLRAWFYGVRKASWRTPEDVKAAHGNASIISNNRVVFNIKGNRYRLVGMIRYDLGILYVRFIGSHEEYNSVDATTI
ncbi:MAG TPA: type II toxin-antitoxin system HigB family toxin [Armatimonadota bacterium]|nr:type II toxin-antitoxin system HigB family toxin [Armatimonadota bacterium]